jgi:hypothetical protein
VDVLHEFYGESPGDNLGTMVSGEIDLDDDDHADLVVSAGVADATHNGYVRIYSGKTRLVLIESTGLGPSDHYGTASRAGHLSPDGMVSLVVGANQYQAPSSTGPGRVYVFHSLGGMSLSSDCNANDIPDECEALDDADFDCDVDLIDFGPFQACFTGTGPTALGDNCGIFDHEPDQDVDLDDFVAFLNAVTGP